MSQRALYRKYRSTSFDEVLGQDHIVNALSKAIEQKSFGHAYLFTGPRGVGKTSIARLLAHQIIGQEYKGDTPEHIDIIEIDAASNTGVDDVRELRDKAYVGPAQADYKVYIIDEVHMLSKAAFNALLKILEEPPQHIVFILATTESYKIPETVMSRTQRFGFRPISNELLTKHIETIAKKEKIKLAGGAAALIAAHGKGSFRDAISLLDQVKNQSDVITLELIQQTLGQLDEKTLQQITEAVATADTKTIIDSLAMAQADGSQPTEIAIQLAGYWRQLIIDEKPPLTEENTLRAIEALIEIPRSNDPAIKLEITLIKYAKSVQDDTPRPTKPITLTTEPAVTIVENAETISEPVKPAEMQLAERSADATAPAPTKTARLEPNESWQAILNTIKNTNNTLYAILRMCHAEISEQKFVLKFGFPFHHRRMQEPRNKEILLSAIESSIGFKPELDFVVDKADSSLQTKPQDKQASGVLSVLGGEMVSI